MPISRKELSALRHPKETPRFYVTLFVLIPLGIIVAALTIASFGLILLIAPLVLFVLWFSLRMFAAYYMNNTILVTAESFPDAHRAIEDAKQYFGYTKPIQAYVYQEGTYNMALMPLLNVKVLLLNSELMRPENNDDELRFLVGRFVGALASKHYRFMWLQAFLNGVEKLAIFNILLYPYERALKLSGDRLGLAMIGGDIDAAVQSMVKLVVGTDIADQVNVDAFVKQGERHGGGFFRWLVKALSTFPHTTTRVSELLKFAASAYPAPLQPVMPTGRAAE
ncbi:M48 family metallopeptidase [uncultured Tateyamaria sp.]|uniref:M48 family metallopeptidase n=1 Tax=uncultured Tateyamaria sp. TaxID=455651 RepID=UPI0026391DAD|nr:M48 family metallopeptidase [uncultured Tateyamaria sp.]